MKAKSDKESYDIARSKLLSYIIPLYSQLDLYHVNDDKKWKHYYGMSTHPIPEGSLVCPIMISDSRAWYLGWYRGVDEEGFHKIESIDTHKICRFGNCGFYYIDDIEILNQPQFHYSDYDFYRDYLIKHKYEEENDVSYVLGYTMFHEDGSFTVKCRRKFCDNFVEKTYKSLGAVTKKQVRLHFEEANEK